MKVTHRLILIGSVLFTGTFTLAQPKFDNFEDAAIYLKGCIGSEIDDYGNLVIDMGSASAGRYSLRLTDVDLTMEERPEEPGCGDVCPPRILITMTCKRSDCIGDPAMEDWKQSSGTFVIYDLPRGKKTFNVLKQLQELL